MTDIVERLRALAPDGMLASHVSDLPALREAAAEIARLRAALRPFAAKSSPYYDQLPDDTPAVVEVGPENRRVEHSATLGDFRKAAALAYA